MIRNKKGFTLIELLAVIVILAIIALIATPIILNVIEDAKEKAAITSAYGFINAINDSNGLDGLASSYNGKTVHNTDDLNTILSKINMSGDVPTKVSELEIENKVVKSVTLCVNNYKISYNGSKATLLDKNCDNMSGNNPPSEVAYYSSTGEPTESDTTDQTTITKNVFIKKEANQLSACIRDANTVYCFKNNHNTEEQSNVKSIFAGGCDDQVQSGVVCENSNFRVIINNDGSVSCNDKNTYDYCGVTSANVANCGSI